MAEVVLTKRNEVYLDVVADPGVAQELSDHFTFEVPGAKFMPQYRARMWDGKIRLFNMMTRELYVGLKAHVEDYCRKNGYTVDASGIDAPSENVTDAKLQAFIETLNLTAHGKSIEMRDYQREAALHAITQERALLLSPTSSGKSLIAYVVTRWRDAQRGRTLILVPTVGLVTQMYGDFADYASKDPRWNPDDKIVTIHGGKEKTSNAAVVISTWQSIYKMSRDFFNSFDLIIGDECHLFKSKSLTGIMHKATQVPRRVGMTGTLDGSQTNKLVLEGLFGPVKQVTTTKKLMDEGSVSSLKIKCLILNYTDEEKKLAKKYTYPEEMAFLVTHPKRNKFLVNLALSRTGNTLMLFQFVEKHGQVLYDTINARAEDGRQVFFVHGGTEASDREAVRKLTETQNNAIIVASSGVFSTGISIRNLHNIIFASPSKSRIRNLQSIGRGLRKSDTKDSCKLYDVADDLSVKGYKNYTLLHMIERVKVYASEQFTYKLIQVPLNG